MSYADDYPDAIAPDYAAARPSQFKVLVPA